MGEVFRARDPRLDRDVALKMLPAGAAGGPDGLARLEREARAAAAIAHPNVVAVFDIGAADGRPYIVSELVEGETLRTRLAAGRLPIPTAVAYARQILCGLAAAHGKGVVHRDLKPENIIVSADGRLKILDFGLAKVRETAGAGDRTAFATQAGTTLGTIGYMAPEQARGEAADERSDLFSCGAILYEMLSGARAFGRGSAAESLAAILSEQPEPLSAARIGPDLCRIVSRLLEKSPDRRYQHAADVEAALDRLAFKRPRGGRRVWSIAAVTAGALVLAAAITWFIRSPAVSRAPITSLAVLPLDNLSRNADQEYFADGMTEALIGDLAQIKSVRVISRTSAMQYKHAQKTIPQIARELHVDAVIEGSVSRDGNRVRVDAQLIDARSDAHLWAQSYARDLRDILTLQHEIATAIAHEVRSTIAADAAGRTARAVNPTAHEAYLRGRHAINTGFDEESIRTAIAHFNAAIAADPSYAPAYAGLADAYIALRSTWVAPRLVMGPAKAAATRALELDPALADAYVSRGSIRVFYDFDWPGGEADLRRALELNPGLASGHWQLAMVLSALARHDEAEREIGQAKALDPLSPPIAGDAAWIAYAARRYDRALDEAQQATVLDPGFWYGRMMLGLAHEKLGRTTQAIAELEKARELNATPMVLEMLGGAYAAAGRTADARRVAKELTDLSAARYVCPYEIATLYAGLGEKHEAVGWLKKAYEERADCAPWMNVDAKLDPLRDDPDFKDLARAMGFR